MNGWRLQIVVGSVALFVGASVLASERPLEVVPGVDLARYVGTWHEIARLPNRFQRQCVGDVTAKYALRDDGRLSVVNACRLADGSVDQAEGVARLASSTGPNSKLEVRFAPAWLSWLPFVWGDYWIIELAPDYSYSVVGTPNRRYLWILARDRALDSATLSGILARLNRLGFDTTRMIQTDHAVGNPIRPDAR
jgi:apolipoprotein D and lipocalin family protein